MKTCKKCKVERELDAFSSRGGEEKHLIKCSYCKPCTNKTYGKYNEITPITRKIDAF